MATAYLIFVETMGHNDLNSNRCILLNTLKLLLPNSLQKSVQATLMWFWVTTAYSRFLFCRFNVADTFQAEFFIKFRKRSGLRGKVWERVLLIEPVCKPLRKVIIQLTVFETKTSGDTSRCLHATNEWRTLNLNWRLCVVFFSYFVQFFQNESSRLLGLFVA